MEAVEAVVGDVVSDGTVPVTGRVDAKSSLGEAREGSDVGDGGALTAARSKRGGLGQAWEELANRTRIIQSVRLILREAVVLPVLLPVLTVAGRSLGRH